MPLVFVSVSDPIGSGFVADLARPGGNVMLLEIAPRSERVGLVYHPEPPNYGYLKSAEAAAPFLKSALTGLPVRNTADIEQALETFAREPRGGLIVAPNVVTFANSSLIVTLAERHRLPAIYPFAYYAKRAALFRMDSMPPINSAKARFMPTRFFAGPSRPIYRYSIRPNSRSSST